MTSIPPYFFPALIQSGNAIGFVNIHTKETAAANTDATRLSYCKIQQTANTLYYSPYITNPNEKYLLNLAFLFSLIATLLHKETIESMEPINKVAKVISTITPLILVTHALALVVFKKSIPHVAFLAFFALHLAYSKGHFPKTLNKPYTVLSDIVSISALLADPRTLIKMIGLFRAHHKLADYGIMDRIQGLPRI